MRVSRPFSLTWLPDVLIEAGLKVAQVEGWQYRGQADMGAVYGVLCHHTGGPKTLNMPSLNTLIGGRPDLSGPLAHVGLGRDGTYYVVAAGRCNHAGQGNWKGVAFGNTNFIGIEAENTGLPDDPWPQVQMEAYLFGVAAILRKLDRGAEWCAGHKEYATPLGRKDDPTFDMAAFRANLAAMKPDDMPSLIPAVESQPVGNAAARPTLRRVPDISRVTSTAAIETLQQKLRITPVDGIFGRVTEAAVRQMQRNAGLIPDGIVGPKTWQALDARVG